MTHFTCLDLDKYEITFSDIYSYKNNYKLNCFLNKKSIIIKTPKSQLNSNLDSGYIVLALNQITKKTEAFINFVKKIETDAGDKIKLKLKKKYKLHSNFVGDTNNLKYIFKNTDKNTTIFDKNKKLISSSQVEIYSDIILLVKLQDIWINTEKRTYGLKWVIFQCRIFPQFDYRNCLIVDSDDDEPVDNAVKNEIIVQKCVFCNSTCMYKNTIENINIGKGKGKGKGKGLFVSNMNTNTTNGGNNTIINNSGRGNNTPKKTEVKKAATGPPRLSVSVNELVNIKNKLRKMTKIVDSDSD